MISVVSNSENLIKKNKNKNYDTSKRDRQSVSRCEKYPRRGVRGKTMKGLSIFIVLTSVVIIIAFVFLSGPRPLYGEIDTAPSKSTCASVSADVIIPALGNPLPRPRGRRVVVRFVRTETLSAAFHRIETFAAVNAGTLERRASRDYSSLAISPSGSDVRNTIFRSGSVYYYAL